MGYCSCQRNPVITAMRNPTVYAMRNPWTSPWDFSSRTPVNKKVIKINYPYSGLEAQEFKTALMYMYSDELLYNPEWRSFVAHVARESGANHDPVKLAHAMSNWLEKNISYLPEPGELIQDPRNTIRYGMGDCDDYTAALNAMLEAAGFATRVVWIQHAQGWHVYLEAKFALGESTTSWIPLDPSMPDGRKGYQTPKDKLIVSHVVDRAIASKYAFPEVLALALTSDDDEVFEIEGGILGQAGIRYIMKHDLMQMPEDASGKLYDRIKKAAPRIRAAVKKVANVVNKIKEGAKKVLASPVFQKLAQTAAKFIPGAGPIIAKVIEVAGKVVEKIDDVQARVAKVKEMAKGLMSKGDPLSKIKAKALELAAQQLGPVKDAALETAATSTVKSLKQKFISGELAATKAPLEKMGELAEAAPGVLEKVTEVAGKLADPTTGKPNLAKLKDLVADTTSNVVKGALLETVGPVLQQVTGLLNKETEKQDKKASAAMTLLSKYGAALLGGKSEIPFHFHKVADAAIRIDTWLNSAADSIKNADALLADMQGSPDYEKNKYMLLQYKSALIEALGEKEKLLQSAAEKLGYKLPPGTDLKKMSLKDLTDAVNMNQLGGIGQIMLSVFTSPEMKGGDAINELNAFASGIESLSAHASTLSKNLIELEKSMVSRVMPSAVMQPRTIAPPAPNYVGAPA